MKFRFFFSVMLFLGFAVSGTMAQQSHNADIQQKFDAFIGYSNNGEWDKVFDVSYPKLFNSVPKEQLVAMMKESEQGLSIQRANTRIVSMQGPIQDGDQSFVRVNYTSDMTVKITPKGIYDDMKPTMAIDQQFKATYGAENVNWDEKNKTFTIKASGAMMAVKGPGTDWTLAEINTDQMAVMEYLFSPAIMSSLVRQ